MISDIKDKSVFKKADKLSAEYYQLGDDCLGFVKKHNLNINIHSNYNLQELNGMLVDEGISQQETDKFTNALKRRREIDKEYAKEIDSIYFNS